MKGRKRGRMEGRDQFGEEGVTEEKEGEREWVGRKEGRRVRGKEESMEGRKRGRMEGRDQVGEEGVKEEKKQGVRVGRKEERKERST